MKYVSKIENKNLEISNNEIKNTIITNLIYIIRKNYN